MPRLREVKVILPDPVVSAMGFLRSGRVFVDAFALASLCIIMHEK
jgi:hypothetical protein